MPPPASVAPLDEAIGSKEWAKRQVRERAEKAQQILAMEAQLATLQAQLVSMLGPRPPSEEPPPDLMTTSASSSSTVAPKAKAVPAPQAPASDLAATLAKRRRKD